MSSIVEIPKHQGVFTVFDHPGYSTEWLKHWTEMGNPIEKINGLKICKVATNLIMASQKLLMAQAVYPNIDRLVITNQTTTPADTETSYSGTIYTTVAGDEFFRSDETNPYQVAWSITTDSANGNWGSFVLITSTGAMINRALAGVTKLSGTGKIVQFTGSVI